MSPTEESADGRADPLDAFRQFFALERDVLVLSVAMFAFSLGFQMTGRYMAEYMSALGLCSTLGFGVWLVAPTLADVAVGPTSLAIVAIFLGLLLAQAWKSFGLGATFAIVKQAVPPSQLAAGFASTETFRRSAFLVGPLVAAALFFPFGSSGGEIVTAFQLILVVAVVV